jgi:hypothetical protein
MTLSAAYFQIRRVTFPAFNKVTGSAASCCLIYPRPRISIEVEAIEQSSKIVSRLASLWVSP